MKIMKLQYILAILLLSISLMHIYAGPEHIVHISGQVIDAKTKEPIVDATISLEGTRSQALSDDDGNFLIKNIHSGKYIIQVQALGYAIERQEINLAPYSTKKIVIELNFENYELAEVAVTASISKLKRDISPIVVSQLTPKTFEATQSLTLSQGLNFSPGVRVETTCQNCGSQEVRINGLEGHYSEILINSQPVVGALTKTYGLDQIPLNMVDEINIIRGGNSALYGSHAIGGVIDIITKEPENNYYEIKYNLSLIEGKSADNMLLFNTSLVDKSKTSGISVFGNMRSRNPWDANDDGFSEIGKNRASSLGFSSFLKPSKDSKIAAEYRYTSEERRGGDSFNKPPHEANIAEYSDFKIHSGSVDYSQHLKGNKHRLNIHLSIQDAYRDSYFGAEQEPNGYGKTTELTLIGNAKYEMNIDNLLFMPAKFVSGYTQSHDMLRNEIPGYNYKQNQNINIGTLYFQNEWQNERLSIAIGARLEKHSLVDNLNIMPRVNARYKIVRDVNLRGGYTVGYRAPEITGGDLDIPIQGGKATLLSFSDNIKPERSRSFSGGLDTKFYNEDFYSYFLIEGFFTRIDNAFIDRFIGENETGNTLVQRENANRATISGINFETSIQPYGWLQIDGGYTIQKGRYKSPERWSDDETIEPTKNILRSPEQYGFISATASPQSPFSIAVSGTYTGSMYVPHLAGYIENDELKKTPQFFDMTTKITYSFKLNTYNKAEINCGIQNIFNSRQHDFDKGINRDADYIYGPSLPRTYFIGLKLSSF